MSDAGSPDIKQNPQPRSRRTFLAVGTLVLLAAAAGGAWYALHSRAPKLSAPSQPRVEAVLHL
ncbi:MAG TPA: hypothetical protein VEG32_07865, partial [Clostridia bacterium]|nr:hypothetical protein [Clostridia bacterium]